VLAGFLGLLLRRNLFSQAADMDVMSTGEIGISFRLAGGRRGLVYADSRNPSQIAQRRGYADPINPGRDPQTAIVIVLDPA